MDDFIGIKESQEFFGNDVFTKRERDELNEVKFSRELIERHKKTHLLIAIPGELSILDLEAFKPYLFNTSHECFRISNNRRFAKHVDVAAWRLIRKDKKPNSELKSWEQQKSLLLNKEYIPNARTVTYTVVMYYLKKEVALFSEDFIRTADFYHSPFERVAIIFDKKYGISMFPRNNDFVARDLGCAVATSLKRFC
jgi:hypothetical protein